MLFDIPTNITFEKALELTQVLLDQMAQGTVSETVIVTTVGTLVSSENGARGFFVVYLSDEGAIADHPDATILQALQLAPDQVAPLLIKNLAMSTAMVVTHQHNQNEHLTRAAERTQRRVLHLLNLLPLPELQDHVHQLLTSIDTATGTYAAFLSRWGYSDEQRQAIRQTLEQTTLIPSSPAFEPSQQPK